MYRKTGPFQAFEQIGQRLMVEKTNDDVFLHKIQNKLDSIRVARAEMRQMWVERTLELDQSLELQRFHAD